MRRLFQTNGLLPKTSFLIGIGSVMSLFSPYYDFRYSNTSEDADREAIFSDFYMVGTDIRNGIKTYKNGR